MTITLQVYIFRTRMIFLISIDLLFFRSMIYPISTAPIRRVEIELTCQLQLLTIKP